MPLRSQRRESSIVVFINEYLVSSVSIWFNNFRIKCMKYVFMLTKLNEVLDRLKQGSSQSPQIIETSDTSEDETDTSKGRRKSLSQKTSRMKKVYVATELGRFSVTRPTDAVNKPIHFYCRVCRKDVSGLRHWQFGMLKK